MKNLTKLSAIALAGSVMMTSAKAVEIEVGYAYSSLFDVTMERLIPEFNKAHPDITVKSGQLMKTMKAVQTPFCVRQLLVICLTSLSKA